MPPAALEATDVVLVVDVANVMGSRPDGWWRDRAGAATRLVAALVPLAGTTVPLGQDGAGVRVVRVVAVVEGRARGIEAPDAAAHGVEVVRAAADGDTDVVRAAADAEAAGERPLVVTADRGLRDRLPTGCLLSGPGRLRDLLESHGLERAQRSP